MSSHPSRVEHGSDGGVRVRPSQQQRGHDTTDGQHRSSAGERGRNCLGTCAASSGQRRRVIPPSVLQLIRELGNINVKKKEPPFCYPYSLKARVLVLSHLARMDVSEELEEGRTLNDKLTLHVLF